MRESFEEFAVVCNLIKPAYQDKSNICLHKFSFSKEYSNGKKQSTISRTKTGQVFRLNNKKLNTLCKAHDH
jgi:hypothetical protein